MSLVVSAAEQAGFGMARPRGYTTCLYSTQLRMIYTILINIKMPTIVDIQTFIGMINTTSEGLKVSNGAKIRRSEGLKAREKSFTFPAIFLVSMSS